MAKIKKINMLFGSDKIIGKSRNSLWSTLHVFRQRTSAPTWLLVCAFTLTATVCTADEIKTLYEQVAAQRASGDYEKMEKSAALLVSKSEKRFGKEHLNTAIFLTAWALSKKELGLHSEAEPLYLRSLKIIEERLGPNHTKTASSLSNIAILYESQGRYDEVEPLYLRSLKIFEMQLGPDHTETAIPLNNLASFYYSQGRYDEAEPLFLRSLKISEERLGADHPQTATYLSNLASLYDDQGRYDEAEPLLLRSLKIREKQLGTDHPETALSLNNLSNLYFSQRRYDEVEPLLLLSLKIREKKFGPDHPATATILCNLAYLYEFQGRYDEAEALFVRSLKIREMQLGQDHTDTAISLSNLGNLYYSQSRYGEAEPLFARSLEIVKKELGQDHPYYSTSLFRIAMLLLRDGRPSEAIPVIEQSLQSDASQWSRMLGYFSERECLAFQKSESPLRVPGSSGSGRLSSEAQLLFKGAILEAMNTRRNDEVRLYQSQAGRELLGERQALAPRYQKAVLGKGATSPETTALRNQLEEIDKHASILLREDKESSTFMGVGLEQVRASLPESTVLLESFRFEHLLEKDSVEPRYATTLIRATGDPIFISHGEATALETAINNYRKALQSSPGDESCTPEERAAQLREAETALYTGILAPLEPHLKPSETVIFSPDAQWHFLPLGMLRNAAGETFSSRYQVRYVSSGRDLVKSTPPRDAAEQSALVLGNPSFRDNAPLLALAESDEGSEKALIASTLRAGLAQDSGSIQFSPLPGTAREASQLTQCLGDSGYKVSNLTGDKATEPALMEAIHGHSIVHLATHGFFLKEDKVENEPQSLGLEDRKPNLASIQNPMYRSGLALSGAQSTFNLWKNGQVPPPSRDGVLLAAEMATLDLRGTDLVVLSACETAAGEALDGEGVIGLRRALNAAGATNVIMTLWPIDDEATVELMEVFYEKYLAGMPAGKALAETQRELFPKWIELHGEVGALARLAPFICTSLGKVE